MYHIKQWVAMVNHWTIYKVDEGSKEGGSKDEGRSKDEEENMKGHALVPVLIFFVSWYLCVPNHSWIS